MGTVHDRRDFVKTIASISRNAGTLTPTGPGLTSASSAKDDALWDEEWAYSLLTSMGGAQFKKSAGTLIGSATEVFRETAACAGATSSSVSKGERSTTSVTFGHSAIMKLYRRVEPGMNPRLEVGQSRWLSGERNACLW